MQNKDDKVGINYIIFYTEERQKKKRERASDTVTSKSTPQEKKWKM